MIPSIARRLTLLVAVIAALVFAVVGALLYIVLDRELVRRETDELNARLNFVGHVLTEVKQLPNTGLAHHLDDMVASHGNMNVWIATADGREVYGGQPPDIREPTTGSFLLRRADGVPVRAVAARLRTNAQLPEVSVLIAADIRPTQRVLAGFGLALAVLCLSGVAAMALLGAWIARRGLAPVNALSAQAHAIGPHALSQRLPEANIPAELVTLAQSFNRVLDRLEQSYRQLEAFNADVAHELRTPLSNLMGSSEVALSRGRTADELRDVLASNLEDLERVKVIVNDMLFLARADRGERVDASHAPLDQVARDVAGFLEPILEERRVKLDVEGKADVPGDAGLLRRAVTNMVSNALKYTAPGSTIRIEIAVEADAASLRVLNPGPEIQARHLPHIFDRFYRAEPSRGGRPEGYGLGLAIVKAIVHMHGGSVFAESHDGITEVGFRLPRAGLGEAGTPSLKRTVPLAQP